MKRSTAPIYWSLFGAGGMLAALLGPGLVLALLVLPVDHEQALRFARHFAGKALLFACATLFLWHAAHRIFHALHDFGVRAGAAAWMLCYGVAIAGTLVSASALLAIGF